MNGEGFGTIIGGEGGDIAFGVILCKHCQKMIRTGKGFGDRSGFCRLCDSFICSDCVGKPCMPWEKQMEKLEGAIKRDEDRTTALKSYGVIRDGPSINHSRR